ncbi:MAG: hypothetical protein H8E98_04605 [Bacteroidetes bacterium]|nr:hypothetical protein [Bacteroidota bacterium]
MNSKEQPFQGIPDEALVSLFFALIRLRQQMENEYYAYPTKALASEVIEIKKMIKWIESVICSESLG